MIRLHVGVAAEGDIDHAITEKERRPLVLSKGIEGDPTQEGDPIQDPTKEGFNTISNAADQPRKGTRPRPVPGTLACSTTGPPNFSAPVAISSACNLWT